MTIFRTKTQFVDAVSIIHENKYTYDNFVYTKLEDKSLITCPIHGDFLQSAHHHYNRKQGCAICGGHVVKTTSWFIEKAREVHGDTYSYIKSIYSNTHKNLDIICKIHGVFSQSPAGHLHQKQGCPSCHGTGQGTTESFIQESIKRHGGLYDYSKVNYINCKTKVIIGCQYHGDFLQAPIHHTRKGSGCRKCNVTGGYSEKWLREHPDQASAAAILYVVQIQNESKSFYKIGITKKDLDIRFHTTRKLGWKVTPIEIFSTSIGKAFHTEQRMLRGVIHKLEKPSDFYIYGGESECFLADTNTLQQIIDKVKSYLCGVTTPESTPALNLSK